MINKDTIKEAYEWFCEYIELEQGEPFSSFSEGVMEAEEGYKKNVFVNAHTLLQLDEWKRNKIGDGFIADKVFQAFEANGNIVEYHSITNFKNKTKSNLKEAEAILYDLFRKSNCKDAFENACLLWGRRFNEMSYLMFIKDKDKYVPVRSSIHREKFKVLDLPTDIFDKCTWDNYQKYSDIMEEVRAYLEELFGMPITLLDAHSFIWKVGDKNYLEKIRRIREAKEDEEMIRWISNGKTDLSSSVERTDSKPKKTNKSKVVSNVSTYVRSKKEVREALDRANYKCEFDNSHKTFIRKTDGLPYTEPHHLIPICFQERFDNSLDHWANIVSLCSNCHNKIHYGKGAEELIEKLYSERKELLKKAGIGITLTELLEMYD